MVLELTKLRAKDLIWTKWNRDHIQKHDLNPRQVEQVFYDKNKVQDKAKFGRISVIGKCGKRLVTMFIVPEDKKYLVVTARDASKKDRQTYRQNL